MGIEIKTTMKMVGWGFSKEKNKEEKKMQETRVGYATTSVLEEMLRSYISSQVDSKGRYIGKPEYITKYQQLFQYNHEVKPNSSPK